MASLRGLQLGLPNLSEARFYAAVNALTWNIQYRFQETATPIVNISNPGTANGTATNVTFNQPGGVEGTNGLSFSAVNAIVTITNSSTWNNQTAFTALYILNAASSIAAGWRLFQNVNDQWLFSVSLTGIIDSRVNRAVVSATYTTGINEIVYPSGLIMLVMRYDETLGITLSRGQAGVLTNITSGAGVIGSGATTARTGTQNMFNNGSSTRNFTGLASFFGYAPTRFSDTTLQLLLTAAGI